MQTSDRKPRIIVSVIILAVLLILAELLMSFLLTSPKSYTRLMLHDFYASIDTAEVVIAGASHPQHGVDPAAMDGMNAVSMASASQSVKDSYYMIAEALRVGSPRMVALEVTYGMFTTFNGYDNPTSSFILYDHMRPSLNKLAFAFAAFDAEDLPDVYLKSYRNRSNFNIETMSANVAAKLTDEYRSFSPASAVNETERYAGLGFVYADTLRQNGCVGRVAPFRWERRIVNDEAVEYVGRIAALCRDAGVELVLFSTPVPYASLAALGDYEDAHSFFADMAAANDLEYLDFNLVKETVFRRLDTDFYDDTHMTGAAAERFSVVLASALRDPAAFAAADNFYPTYGEMTEDLDRIWNVWLTASQKDGTVTLKAASQATSGIEVEYSISLVSNDLQTILSDFGAGDSVEYSLGEGESARFLVEARRAGGEVEQSAMLDFGG